MLLPLVRVDYKLFFMDLCVVNSLKVSSYTSSYSNKKNVNAIFGVLGLVWYILRFKRHLRLKNLGSSEKSRQMLMCSSSTRSKLRPWETCNVASQTEVCVFFTSLKKIKSIFGWILLMKRKCVTAHVLDCKFSGNLDILPSSRSDTVEGAISNYCSVSDKNEGALM